MNKDKKAQRAIEQTGKKEAENSEHPSAGPHAKEHLIDKSKTPGAGALPNNNETEVSPGSG